MKVLSASLESLSECKRLIEAAHGQWKVSTLSDNDYKIIRTNLQRASANLVGIPSCMGLAVLQASLKQLERTLYMAKYITKITQAPSTYFKATIERFDRVADELKSMAKPSTLHTSKQVVLLTSKRALGRTAPVTPATPLQTNVTPTSPAVPNPSETASTSIKSKP